MKFLLTIALILNTSLAFAWGTYYDQQGQPHTLQQGPGYTYDYGANKYYYPNQSENMMYDNQGNMYQFKKTPNGWQKYDWNQNQYQQWNK